MKKTALIAIFLSFFCLVNLAWGEGDLSETKRLAESGDTGAQFILGFLYFKGLGVPQNYAEAMKWYRKAADQGDDNAQFLLGSMYYLGKGVPRNFIKAYVWSSVASTKGNEKAKEILEILNPTMTPQQIAQAQNEAAELWKRINKSKK